MPQLLLQGFPDGAIRIGTDISTLKFFSVPGQPSDVGLAADPLLHRFIVVFDREGSSHDLSSL